MYFAQGTPEQDAHLAMLDDEADRLDALRELALEDDNAGFVPAEYWERMQTFDTYARFFVEESMGVTGR